MSELTQFEILDGFFQIFRCAFEERPQSQLDGLQAGFHQGSVQIKTLHLDLEKRQPQPAESLSPKVLLFLYKIKFLCGAVTSRNTLCLKIIVKWQPFDWEEQDYSCVKRYSVVACGMSDVYCLGKQVHGISSTNSPPAQLTEETN